MGSYDDAILVQCDMHNQGWTVVEAARASAPFRNWFTGDDGFRWFGSEISGTTRQGEPVENMERRMERGGGGHGEDARKES